MWGSDTDASAAAAPGAGAAPAGGASGGGYDSSGESGDEEWLWDEDSDSTSGWPSDSVDSCISHNATVKRELGSESAVPAIDAPSISSASSDVKHFELPPEFIWDAAPAAEAGWVPLPAASQAAAPVPAAKRSLAKDATASKRARPSPGTVYTSGPSLPHELAFRLLTNADERCSGARPMFLNAQGVGAPNGRIYKEQANVTAEGKLQAQSKRPSSSDFWRKSARGSVNLLGRFYVDANGQPQLCSAGADTTEGGVGDVLLKRQYRFHSIIFDKSRTGILLFCNC